MPETGNRLGFQIRRTYAKSVSKRRKVDDTWKQI